MKTQKTPGDQNNLESKNSAGRIMCPEFRLYQEVTIVKEVWYWLKIKHIDQQNRIRNSEINACTYHQLIYNKGGKNIQWRKDSLSISGAGKTGQLHIKE